MATESTSAVRAAYTPGPWIVRGGDDTSRPLPIYSDSADEIIAMTRGQPRNFDDARLIAAAPALFAALRAIVDKADALGHDSPELCQARRALAKVQP